MLILTVLTTLHLCAQENLVPNPGFEDHETCPDQILHDVNAGHQVIPHWYTPTKGTPDYYHSCSNSYKTRTGNNWIGEIKPHSGDGLIGLLGEDDLREYIRVKLKEPMKKNTTYKVTYWIAHASKSYFVTNGVGVLFTPDNELINEHENIFKTPSVLPGKYLHNLEWEEVTGTYLADGGEQYLTLGNTQTSRAMEHQKKNTEHGYCYYFLDDISVVERAYLGSLIKGKNRQHFKNYAAENHVQNGGFEQMDCQKPATEWHYRSGSRIALGWRSFGRGTPDGITGSALSCAEHEISGYDGHVFTQDIYTGHGMGGLIAAHAVEDTGSNDVEYFLGKLQKPLERGKDYYVSIMVRCAPMSDLSINNLGLRFYREAPKKKDSNPIKGWPDVAFKREKTVTSSEGWVRLTARYSPVGREACFVLGGFDSTLVVEGNKYSESYPEPSKTYPFAYYYIDDVVISEDSTLGEKFLDNTTAYHAAFLIDTKDSDYSSDLYHHKQIVMQSLGHFNASSRVTVAMAGEKPKMHLVKAHPRGVQQIQDILNPLGPTKESNLAKGLKLIRKKAKFGGNGMVDHLFIVTEGMTPTKGMEATIKKITAMGVKVHILCTVCLKEEESAAMEAVAKSTGANFKKAYPLRSIHLVKILAGE